MSRGGRMAGSSRGRGIERRMEVRRSVDMHGVTDEINLLGCGLSFGRDNQSQSNQVEDKDGDTPRKQGEDERLDSRSCEHRNGDADPEKNDPECQTRKCQANEGHEGGISGSQADDSAGEGESEY